MLRRSGLWVPLLIVGSALYWTVAFGLGAVSLSLVSGGSLELVPPHDARPPVEEPILVRLEPSGDPEDQPAEGVRVDLQSVEDEDEDPQRDDGPGKTAF